jgi:Fe-Mn family superoxide dismutase
MQDLRQLVTLVESVKDDRRLEQTPLPYDRKDLYPSKSKETLDYHYGTLYKGYVDRYNKDEGDPDFNEAGAFLHDLYFTELQEYSGVSRPSGASEALINRRFGSFDKFKEELAEEAMKIQGSGWIYLSRSGEIKTIKNHQIKKDIALLIDWWEHAWALDYQADKAKYLKNFWSIINWEVINRRIYGGTK